MVERRKFQRRKRPDPQTAEAEAHRLDEAEATLRAEAEAQTLARTKADRARDALERRRARRAQLEAEARQAEEVREAEAARLAEEARREREIQQAEADRRHEIEHAETVASAEALRHAEPHPEPGPAPSTHVTTDPASAWMHLSSFSVDARHLERQRIVTAAREDPAHVSFDILRTRLLQALSDNGWKRVAITSPTKDCGKTFTAANLAISLSRQQNCRTLLLDCDLRRPSLHKVMGVEAPGSMGDMLRGTHSPERHLVRLGENAIHAGGNIAFGFNDRVETLAGELLQSPGTAATLRRIDETLAPDVMLFDLPPALYFDDVMAFRPLFDGVLLVVGGGLTTPKEVREVERRLGSATPLLGTVLNRAEGTTIRKYTY